MRGADDFVAGERARAARWKAITPTLDDADRARARWCRDGAEVGPPLPFGQALLTVQDRDHRARLGEIDLGRVGEFCPRGSSA